MSKKELEKNPIKPFDSITVNSTEYKLIFEFGTIAQVEEELDKALITGLNQDIIYKPKITLVQSMLYALVKAARPDITFGEVKGLVTVKNYQAIWEAVLAVWLSAYSQPTAEEQVTEKNS